MQQTTPQLQFTVRQLLAPQHQLVPLEMQARHPQHSPITGQLGCIERYILAGDAPCVDQLTCVYRQGVATGQGALVAQALALEHQALVPLQAALVIQLVSLPAQRLTGLYLTLVAEFARRQL
ncbi:hypothetical protein, partial [Aeromonas rivipollensis]|uniref:hypothetical protein n=1 Tax=Aeromonas rivipollensis TaxID=948519 RepID=UPI00373AE631